MMDVTGLNHRMSRDRIKFFKRPVMPSTAPTPSVRYSKELTQSETGMLTILLLACILSAGQHLQRRPFELATKKNLGNIVLYYII